MDLSAIRRKLSPEERQKRIAEGRCLYCGGFGHLALSCPAKPNSGNTLRANETAFQPSLSSISDHLAENELSQA
jgi:hypothetical protein